MKELKKDLQALSKGLQALAKKAEALTKQLEKVEPAKAKAVKKAPVKKKAAGITDTDKVLNIIKRSPKGASVQALIKKTGFNAKKIANIVHKAFKEAKIKRADKGIYIKP